jgi:uncharacterized protein (TIGR02246 family)
MNWNKIVMAALSMLITGCGNEKSSDPAGNSKDQAEIKLKAKAYEEAFNSYDVEKLAAFWTSNAVYVAPDTGNKINGRSSILNYFKDFFANGEQPKIHIIVDDVTFTGPNKAIENGHVKSTYKDGSEEVTAYQAEDVKENGKWLLQTVREVDIGSSPSNYQHLKDLDWLIGNWEDTDENSDINLNFKWDKNNNFLIEHFTVQILNRDEMEGIQIIGWDPDKKKIHSWVFDSDGGFREGTWSKKGDHWVAAMGSTLADGKKASSIDVYTKVDDNNFTFDMDARDVDGELLPDIGPVHFKKKI